MWNDNVKAFTAWDRRSEQFSDAITSASMLSLYAGAGSSKQQKYTIEHCERILKDCNFGFPSLDPNHNGFEGKRYWRGPIWSIMNYLIALGLDEVGEDQLAKKIRTDTINLTEKQGMAEYFDPHSGIGLGGKDFSWTAAIYLEFLKEDIDINFINIYKDKKNGLNKT